ncbi:uncharacterized protein LOC125232120 [Leguminivora glycinivorella]|uniref:uncharacterized protein LOC125232120 n=1 Tax=Leguminivora glycinivorella TaxID=1035111 RepID=UPI00200BE046|nr:uncharacterized protein LOC125232120 [Leguminivora glycinivorella]
MKDRNRDPAREYALTSEEEVAIKESIDAVKREKFVTNDKATTKAPQKSFNEKYGTLPPRSKTAQPTFKDFMEKYALTTVWEQIDKERIVTGKNPTPRKEMVSLVKGIDNTDELLSLKVENGKAKLPVLPSRRFRPGKHNQDANFFQFNYMHIHQYMIELMKQAIYQARNRMIFMQSLREQHKASGLYKMGFLFAKTDQAGKTFASVSQKSFRMCSMIRQGFMGTYRPYQSYLDIAYALERMETKWFDVDLLSDMIVLNDNMVRYQIFVNRTLKRPRDLAASFDKMFME